MSNSRSKDNNAKRQRSIEEQKEALDEFRHLIRLEGIVNPSKVLEDEFLLRFLRARDFDVQRALELLKNFKKLHENKNFKNFLPSKLRLANEQKVFRVLKGRDLDGCSIAVVQLKHWEPSSVPHMEVVFCILMLLWEILFDIRVQENGVTFVWDCDNFTFRHLSGTRFESTKIAGTAGGRNSYPFKLKKIIILKPTTLVLIFWNLLSSFLSRKILSRVTMVNGSFATLHNIIDPAVLPEYLGGTLSEEDAFDSEIENRIFSNEQYYKNINELFCNEK